MTYNMIKSWTFIVTIVVTKLVNVVSGGAVLQLQMVRYENSASKDWSGSCCDLFCWSKCDHIFTFNLDLSAGLVN